MKTKRKQSEPVISLPPTTIHAPTHDSVHLHYREHRGIGSIRVYTRDRIIASFHFFWNWPNKNDTWPGEQNYEQAITEAKENAALFVMALEMRTGHRLDESAYCKCGLPLPGEKADDAGYCWSCGTGPKPKAALAFEAMDRARAEAACSIDLSPAPACGGSHPSSGIR